MVAGEEAEATAEVGPRGEKCKGNLVQGHRMKKTTQVTVNEGVGGAATTSFGHQKVSKEDGGREEDGDSDMGKGEVKKGEGQVGTNLGEPLGCGIKSSPTDRAGFHPHPSEGQSLAPLC